MSRHVAELVNLPPHDADPYVGSSAFAHKGGLHTSALGKAGGATYEHIDPGIGRQPHAGAGVRPRRPGRHGDEGQGVRRRPRRPGRRRAVRASSKRARVRGLRVRGGRRLARAADAPGHRVGAGLLHRRGLPGHHLPPRHAASRPRPRSRCGSATSAASRSARATARSTPSTPRCGPRSTAPSRRSSTCTSPTTRCASSTTTADTDAVVRVLIESTNGDDVWTTIGVSHEHHRGSLAGAHRLARLRPAHSAAAVGSPRWLLPSTCRSSRSTDVRAYESPPRRPDQWRADRPGDLAGRPARRAPSSACPGPDQGYAPQAGRRAVPRRCSSPVAVASTTPSPAASASPSSGRRCSAGRPIAHDLRVAFTMWGFLDDARPPSSSRLREAWFAGVAHPHHYAEARRIVDAVRRGRPSRDANEHRATTRAAARR